MPSAPLTESEIHAKVAKLIHEITRARPSVKDYQPDGELTALHFDSHDRIELSMTLDEEFEIDVPPDAVAKFVTVQDVVDYLLTLKV